MTGGRNKPSILAGRHGGADRCGPPRARPGNCAARPCSRCSSSRTEPVGRAGRRPRLEDVSAGTDRREGPGRTCLPDHLDRPGPLQRVHRDGGGRAGIGGARSREDEEEASNSRHRPPGKRYPAQETMPELPEVEVVRRGLDRPCGGRRIVWPSTSCTRGRCGVIWAAPLDLTGWRPGPRSRRSSSR